MTKPIPSLLITGALLALLTACGGGGGGDAGSTGGGGTPVTPTDVAITSANEDAVARAAAIGGLAIAQTSAFDVFGRASASDTRSTASVDGLLRRASALLGVGRDARPAAVTSGTDLCIVSGSVTRAFDDRDGDQKVSVGDVITVTFNQCRDTGTSLLDGSIALTVSGVTSPTQFVGSAVFKGVASTEGALLATVDGTLALSESDTNVTSIDTLTVGATGLTVGIVSPGYADEITFAPGMVFITDVDAQVEKTLLTMNGSFTSSALGGRVTLSEPSTQMLALPQGGTFPVSGQLRIAGTSGSAIVVTAISAFEAELQLDANGDGVVDGTVDVDWATLVPE